MNSVFAILHEPASYTVDRNEKVYDPLNINYCYITDSSKANNKKEINRVILSKLPFFSLIKKLKAVLKDNDIIIMNGYTGKYFLLLFLLNFFYRRKIGLDSDTPLNIPSNPIKKIVKSIYLNTVFRNPNIFGLSGGTGSHKDLFRHYGMKENRILLMPMMIDNNKFKGEVRALKKPFEFLYVGRIIEIKNIDLMIKAFLTSFGNSEDFKLKIVGDGSLLPVLKNKYCKHNNVLFTGPKFGSDLINEYKNASAFILPSYFEPWGLVVNEAMAAGLPVIVSDKVGAMHDLVKGKQTGFVFHHDSVDDLSKKIKRLVSDPSNYHKMSKNAYNLMHNYWNYDLYKECLNNFISSAV